MFIPHPGSDFFPFQNPGTKFFHPGSRIRIKEFKYFTQNIVSKLSEIWSGLFNPDPDSSGTLHHGIIFYPSWIPDPGNKKAPDPGSSSATRSAWIQGRDTMVRDDLSQDLKIQGIDDPTKNVQGYPVQGQFITASLKALISIAITIER
jgi:hypothetical protein